MMRRRRNPIERSRARRPLILPYLIAGFLGFVLTPIWMIVLGGEFSLSFESSTGSSSFSSSSSSSDQNRVTVFFSELWFLATVMPGVFGVIFLATGWDLNRSPLKAHGWQYRTDRIALPANRHHVFPLGASGKQRVARLAWGPVGNRLASCYTFWTSHKHRYSVEQLELPADLPPVMLVPANAYDKVVISLGGQDIRVESAVFNERWRVMSPHPAAAHAFLSPRIMERLLAGDVKDMAISIDGGAILSWWPGLTALDEASRNLGVLSDVVDLIPQSLYHQYGKPRDPSWGDVTPSEATSDAPVAAPVAAPGPTPDPASTFYPEPR